MKNNLKNKIEYCGLNYNAEIRKISIINIAFLLIGIGLYFVLKEVRYIVSLVLLLLTIDYLLISNYSTKMKQLDEEREDEFITVISYFKVFISNKNNVYQSFVKTIPYCNDWMKDVISNFLKDIDNDKTVQPFVNFATNFKAKIVTNIMLSIFSMVDQGESFDQISQFQIVFEQLEKSRKLEKLDKKQRSLSSLASLPLIGAAGMTVALTISVVSIIGDLVNVI